MAKRKPAAVKRLLLSSGEEIELDGDLVFLVDALYREFALKRNFAPAYGEVQQELQTILDQMDPASAREYFLHSLFLNYVTYENEMAARIAERIAKKAAPTAKPRAPKRAK